MTVKVRADGARRSGKGRSRAALMALSGVLALPAVAACGGHDGGGARGGATGAQGDIQQAPQSDGPLTVWVDATRLAAAKLYQKTHPSAKLNIVSYDGDADGSHYLQTKVSLFNRTRKGWPDVVFSTQNYEALGKKVATEHPGYIVGSAGDNFTPEIYMWASKCGANQITGPKAVTVNTTSANCSRMAALLDTLVKNRTMSKSSVFSSDFDKNQAGKILMLPGPSWFGGALFEGTMRAA